MHKKRREPLRPHIPFILIAFGLLFGSAPLLPAQEISRAEGRRILERVDSLVSYEGSDFSAEYTVTQQRPGQGNSTTVMTMFRRDSEDTYTIIITDPPADRGKGYLKVGNNLYLYDPTDRRFTVVSARDRFQNTNARNSDFTQSTLSRDYEILSVEETTLGRHDAWLYELESDRDGVTYPYMKAWITEDGRILKTEDYSRSRQLLRVTAVPEYQRLGDKQIPRQIYLIDMLEGARIDGEFVNERTIITVQEPSFEAVPDSVFSKAFLERMAR